MSDSQINIIINTMKAGFGDRDAKSALKELNSGFQAATGLSLTYAGALTATIAVGKKLIDWYKEAEAEANTFNVTEAKQNAILKATGDAAGMTGDELMSMADRLSKSNGILEGNVIDAQALMLTYQNISGSVFPQAMQAAIDMSTTFGGLESSSKALGMALNDPEGSLTKLQRAGIKFTDTQVAMIHNFVDTNQVAKAQELILDVVNAKVGGTAQAMEAASDGSDRLKVSADALSRTIGESVVPATKVWNLYLANTYDEIVQNIKNNDLYEQALENVAKTHGLTMQEMSKHVSAYKDEVSDEVGELTRAEGMNERGQAQMAAMGYTLDATTGQWVKNTDAIVTDTDALAKSIKAASDWEVKYTGLKTVQDQIDLGWDALTTGLEDMGVKGNEAANVLLEGLGKIAPAAAEAYAETQKILGDLNSAISEGYSPAMVAYIAKTEQDSYNNATNPTTSTATSGTTGNQYDSSGKVIPHNNGVNGYYDNAGTWHYTKMALGGLFGAGEVMMVGEKGPEKVVFNQGGTVIPNGAGGGGNITINVSGAGDPKTVAKEVINQLKLQGVGRGQ